MIRSLQVLQLKKEFNAASRKQALNLFDRSFDHDLPNSFRRFFDLACQIGDGFRHCCVAHYGSWLLLCHERSSRR